MYYTRNGRISTFFLKKTERCNFIAKFRFCHRMLSIVSLSVKLCVRLTQGYCPTMPLSRAVVYSNRLDRSKVKKVNTDIAVRNRNYHTTTGNHMPHVLTTNFFCTSCKQQRLSCLCQMLQRCHHWLFQ